MKEITSAAPQSRGPIDHNVREQILEAAQEHFSHYGFDKTTVSDLAKAIGFSKAYVYKFFDSKEAIGEAICAKTLSAIGASLFFNDRKLHDIAAHSAGEGWPSARAYAERIRQILMEVVREGRETGEFERKTPLDETVHAIYLVVHPYVNPLLLQHNLDLIEEAPAQLSNLVLRSLAP